MTDDGRTPYFKTHQVGSGPSVSPTRILGPAASALLPQKPEAPDGRSDAITKAVNGAFAQSIIQAGEKYKKENLLRGMQAAAMGKSIQEIQEEQPWYSRIFGKNDVVTGAEQYAKATYAKETMHSIQADMPFLRTLDADSFRKAVMDRFELTKTGVTDVDLDVQQQLLSRFPDLVANHTKANYQYKQEMALKKQTEFTQASLDDLNDSLRSLSVDPSSASGRETAAFNVMKFDADTARVDGQDEEAYLNNFSRIVETHIRRQGEPITVMGEDGNPKQTFRSGHATHAILLASENFKKLSQAEQARLWDLAETHSRKMATNFMLPYANELAKMDAMIADPPPGVSVPRLVKQKQELLEKVRKDMGSPFEVYRADQRIRDGEQAGRAIARKQEQQLQARIAQSLAAQAGAQREAAQDATIAQLQNLSITDNLLYRQQKAAGIIPKKLAELAENKLYWGQQTPEGRQNVLQMFPDVIEVASAEKKHQADLVLSKPTDVAMKSTDETLHLLQTFQQDLQTLGPEKASKYWSPERFKALRMANDAAMNGAPPEMVVGTLHKVWHGSKDKPVSEKALTAASEAMHKAASKGAWATFWDSKLARNPLTGTGLSQEGNRSLAMSIARRFEVLQDALPSAPPDHLMTQAQQEVLGNGPHATHELVGNVVVDRLFADQGSVNEYLIYPPGNRQGIPTDKVGEALEEALQPYLQGDVTAHSLTFSSGGHAKRVVLTTYTEQGGTQHIPILLDSILEGYHSKRKAKKAQGAYVRRADR